MVCETLINKKLMYRLYAASRLTKICVLLLLILVKQMLDMASIESNKSSSFFLIGLSIWAIVEIVVYFVDQEQADHLGFIFIDKEHMTHEEREIFLALIREKMPQVKVHEKERKNN